MWGPGRLAALVGAVLVASRTGAGAAGALYVGAGACAAASCHARGTPRGQGDVGAQSEYLVWAGDRHLAGSHGDDRHRRAYTALLTERGLRIARRLGMAGDRASAGDWLAAAAEPARCLVCHATHDPAADRRSTFIPSDGVSCESCHGAAGGWKDAHVRQPYPDSLDAGMAATRDPVAGGRLCFGCHLGSATQRVDHELLAAGHPPLVFELDTFATFAPHWTQGPDNARWFGGTPWVVGQLLALRAATELAAQEMRTQAWPDFAAYDCYSCHHRLTPETQWRQRPARGAPGLPPWNPARHLVLSRVVRVVAPAQAAPLDAAVERLAALIRDGRSGPEAVRACDEVVRISDRVLENLRRTPLDDAVVTRLVRALSRDGSPLAYAGFATAQQVAWGLDSLATARASADGTSGAIRRLLDGLDDPVTYEPARFARDLAEVERRVR